MNTIKQSFIVGVKKINWRALYFLHVYWTRILLVMFTCYFLYIYNKRNPISGVAIYCSFRFFYCKRSLKILISDGNTKLFLIFEIQSECLQYYWHCLSLKNNMIKYICICKYDFIISHYIMHGFMALIFAMALWIDTTIMCYIAWQVTYICYMKFYACTY